jgi:hypothetical protein
MQRSNVSDLIGKISASSGTVLVSGAAADLFFGANCCAKREESLATISGSRQHFPDGVTHSSHSWSVNKITQQGFRDRNSLQMSGRKAAAASSVRNRTTTLLLYRILLGTNAKSANYRFPMTFGADPPAHGVTKKPHVSQ